MAPCEPEGFLGRKEAEARRREFSLYVMNQCSLSILDFHFEFLVRSEPFFLLPLRMNDPLEAASLLQGRPELLSSSFSRTSQTGAIPYLRSAAST